MDDTFPPSIQPMHMSDTGPRREPESRLPGLPRLDAAAPPARRWRTLLLALAPLALSACASLSPDAGVAPLEQAARQQLKAELQAARTTQDQDRIAARVAELLRLPLSADAAVQIALLNNRGLQASLQSLGIAEAELVQALTVGIRRYFAKNPPLARQRTL